MTHVRQRSHLVRPPWHSVDGHALQIDELQGTKPTEKIDLSGKKLNVASAIIIASCVKENNVLKELKCAAHPSVLAALAPTNVPALFSVQLGGQYALRRQLWLWHLHR